MKRIGVYYICTGIYKNWFKGFLESLVLFMPDDEKNIIIISDGLDEYENYQSQDGKVKVIIIDKIHYYPWPIVTLFKFKYILDNKISTMDYCFYFNANSCILEKSTEFWHTFNNHIDKNDLIVSYHAVNSVKKNKKDFIRGTLIRNKKSTSYIKEQNYYRLQAAFFGGNATAVYQMCSEHLNLLTEDLKNNMIAPAADESYYNKYIHDNPNKLKIHCQMIIFPEEKGYLPQYDNEIFVKLRYNDNYKDNKSSKDSRNIIEKILSKLSVLLSK